MSKKYYWLKIGEHFFDSDEMIYLESLEKGDTYIKIWMKLLLKCLKDKDDESYGFLKFNDKIPYTEQLLSQVLRCDINDLRVAMKYFQELNMIEILEDKTIYIESVQKLVGKESDSAERVRKHREKKKLLQCNDTAVTCNSNKEKEVEVNKEVEKEKKPLVKDNPPTLNDILEYTKEKGITTFDEDYFYNYFTEKNWIDSKGNPVANWKLKLLRWHKGGWAVKKKPLYEVL